MTNNLKYFTGQLESAPEGYIILRNLIEENRLDMVCISNEIKHISFGITTLAVISYIGAENLLNRMSLMFDIFLHVTLF